MKKIVVLAVVALLAVIPAAAQKDLSQLNKMTDAQIKNTFGQPKKYTDEHEYTGGSFFEYDDMRIFFCHSENNSVRLIDCFQICSSRVKLLSNFITGGVKVGDRFSKIENFDFSKTRYGRGNAANGLKETDFAYHILDKYPVNYVIFSEEMVSVYLCVQNGVIKAMSMVTMEDAPYEGYDFSNYFFANQ